MSEANEAQEQTNEVITEEPQTIVTVDQGKIYVAKEKDPTPLKLRFTLVMIQASISATVLAICAFVIVQTPENHNQKAVAWSTLASTLALWLPSPVNNSNK